MTDGPGDRGVHRDETAMMRRSLAILAATAMLCAGLWWAVVALGTASIGFAFVVVWLPMVWLGTISRLVTPRLPRTWYRLRPVEVDGRLYERLGVRRPCSPWLARRPRSATGTPRSGSSCSTS